MLKINAEAPDFSLPDETGTIRTLGDYVGQWTVLYFYPKDDTPGCTQEACAIAEVYDEFAKRGVVVLGISKDTSVSHAKFKEKYHLPFTLLSDESTKIIQAYDAWQERSLYSKKYMGTVRVSYLLAPDGTIAKVYPKVTPADHALELLRDITELQAA
jgi:peroxiredoxin Q/BCP